MRESERLITIGFILALIGFIVIAVSSSTEAMGFVFVFPFFFVGDLSGPFMTIALASMTFMFIVFFFCLLRARTPTEMQKYVKIGSLCEYCSKPVPKGSTFCPSCGSPLGEDSADRYDPRYFR